MKILITGARGMLGTDLTKNFLPHFKVVGASRTLPAVSTGIPYHQIDLTHAAQVKSWVEKEKPDFIFNAAAKTDVDGCEKNRPEALQQNFETTKNLVDACALSNAHLVHFSTDYVFSGAKQGGEYSEDDQPSPLSVYGETKLLAEKYIYAKSPRATIFRVSWLFGENGRSFPRTIIEKSKETSSFEIVDDQIGRPTYTLDIAEAFTHLLKTNATSLSGSKGVETFHLTNSGDPVSWYGLAKFIFDTMGKHNMTVSPIPTIPGMRPALRPKNAVLALSKVEKRFQLKLRHWQEAVKDFVELKTQRITS